MIEVEVTTDDTMYVGTVVAAIVCVSVIVCVRATSEVAVITDLEDTTEKPEDVSSRSQCR